MKFSDYAALSFDCYGTLIDWERGIANFLSPWAQRQNCTLTEEELLVVYSEHEARVERENGSSLYPEILALALAGVADELGLSASAHELEAFGTSVPDWPAFWDSMDALTSLSNTHKLIILSNVDRQSFAGSNARLGVEFDAVVTAQDVGSYKPSPANFEALKTCAAGIGLESEQVLHVAQSLFHDHVPAKAAGFSTVWINRRHDLPGWGATPDPQAAVSPDIEYNSMEAFAQAVRGNQETAPSS